jgi:hypothetical protein
MTQCNTCVRSNKGHYTRSHQSRAPASKRGSTCSVRLTCVVARGSRGAPSEYGPLAGVALPGPRPRPGHVPSLHKSSPCSRSGRIHNPELAARPDPSGRGHHLLRHHTHRLYQLGREPGTFLQARQQERGNRSLSYHHICARKFGADEVLGRVVMCGPVGTTTRARSRRHGRVRGDR